MVRPRVPASRKRNRVSISPNPDFLAWIDAQVGPGKRWKDRTHAIDYSIAMLMQEEAGKKDSKPR